MEALQEKQEKYVQSDSREKQRAELLEKIGKILAQHGGLEGNIPITSEYWNLTHQYRGLK